MSIVAIVPVASMKAANDALNAAGFGPGNFSVPAYGATGVTHAMLHAWDDPAFLAALEAIPEVTLGDPEAEGDVADRVMAAATDAGATWGQQAAALPGAGSVTPGVYRFEDALWSVIQAFSRTTYPAHPSTYPALIRRLRDPREPSAWRQPIDQFDSYKLVNAFTGLPDTAIHAGKTWRTKVDNNVWEPAVGALWDEIDAAGNVVVPPVEEWPAWKPWTGINADLYQVGAKVSHAGKRWVGNTPNNHWTPGEYGWTQQP